jgi:hypothetical protein
MSAPIPVFKIRCVFFIILLFIAFMLLGLTRRAFAQEPVCPAPSSSNSCGYSFSASYYTTYDAAQADCLATGQSCWTLNLSFFGLPAGTQGRFVKSGSQTCCGNYCNYDLYLACPDCVDADADGKCDPCQEERAALEQQCGSTGYTMVDEDSCEGRCNDCVASAQGQCRLPSIIVWNDDSECSFDCLPDDDGDGKPDVPYPDADPDGDGIPNRDDPDDDGDGIPDVSDPDADPDGDGIPNRDDPDDDGDGIPDVSDPDADPDGDGIPNGDDPDDDGDGIPDESDPDADPDGDGKTNDEDEDDDNDGVPDAEDPDNDKYTLKELPYSWTSDIGGQLGSRFQQFIAEMKDTSFFSIPGQIFGDVPSGGSSSITFDGGEHFGGQQEIDFSNWSSGLAAIRAALYAIFAAVAVKIGAFGR